MGLRANGRSALRRTRTATATLRDAALLGAVLLGVATSVAGCGERPAPGAPAHTGAGSASVSAPAPADGRPHAGKVLRVLAAASLTDVLTEIGRTFEETEGCRVVLSFGASSALAQQIREGAPAGMFLSASPEWAEKVESWGCAEPGSRTDLLGNALVVVVPKNAHVRPSSLSDLADARYSRIAIADPAAVPAGKYAKSALEKAGLFEAVRTRLVAAQDVRGALAWVARGEAAAGIVYTTDAAASPDVDVAFRVPAELHPAITYPGLVVKGADPAAAAFLAFLQGERARAVFERAGFTVAPGRR